MFRSVVVVVRLCLFCFRFLIFNILFEKKIPYSSRGRSAIFTTQFVHVRNGSSPGPSQQIHHSVNSPSAATDTSIILFFFFYTKMQSAIACGPVFVTSNDDKRRGDWATNNKPIRMKIQHNLFTEFLIIKSRLHRHTATHKCLAPSILFFQTNFVSVNRLFSISKLVIFIGTIDI